MLWLLLSVFVAMALCMAIGWAFQAWRNNGGWTDVVWTFATGLVGALAALAPLDAQTIAPRQILVAVLVAFWSARLGLHIRARVVSTPEDARYARFREEWAPHFQRGMFGFLQVQAAAGAALLISVVVAAHNPAPHLGPLDLAGAAVLVIAVLGEGLADRQLRGFAHDPRNKGRVCDVGLWGWSRHPNYVFEWLGWVAYPVIALDLSGAYPWAFAALIAPAAMYGLLRYGSGVPPLEQHMLASRGDAFRAYQARVSVFFPLPPRHPLQAALRARGSRRGDGVAPHHD
jgi:steroid 5-alpha reductase family enzyme